MSCLKPTFLGDPSPLPPVMLQPSERGSVHLPLPPAPRSGLDQSRHQERRVQAGRLRVSQRRSLLQEFEEIQPRVSGESLTVLPGGPCHLWGQPVPVMGGGDPS